MAGPELFGDCNRIGVAPIVLAEPVQARAGKSVCWREPIRDRFSLHYSVNLCDDWQPPRYREAKEDELLFFIFLLSMSHRACAFHSHLSMAFQPMTLDPKPSMSSQPLDSRDRQRHQDVADKPF